MTVAQSLLSSELIFGTERPTNGVSEAPPVERPRLRSIESSQGSIGDDEFVARAREGDRGAFRMLIERHQKRVYQLVFSIVKERELALDLVQETFVKIHRGLPSFKGDAAFYTWAYRIASNLALDARRRQSRYTHVPCEESTLTDTEMQNDLYATVSPSPQNATLRRELAAELERAMSRLSDSHRAILMLREVDGLSYEELAKTLKIPKGTVMSRLFHARQKLQEMLRPYVMNERPAETRAS